MAVKWPKAEGRRAVLHEREKYKQSNEKTEKNNILLILPFEPKPANSKET